ncbi:MAG TPA: IclR family transcriptional regulator [Microbacteriaceae bacterium]|nr:IclR family transcriptional regulator [Microbacteriaceae bacterium]
MTKPKYTHPAEGGPRTVRSVVHAVWLLKEISLSPTPSSLGSLAAAIGLSKPATFNLLKTLEVEGLVAKDDAARYRLTWGVYELGSAVVRSADLSRVSRIHLDRLADETGEAVLLAILNERTVLYIDRGQSGDSFAMVANVGRRSPLHTNASGKVLLAGQPDDFVEEILRGPLERHTDFTIVDPVRLRAELSAVRRDGYALCEQEQETGLSSVSVPVTDYTGGVLAALTIAAPSQRIDHESIPAMRDALLRAAQAISTQMGAAADPSTVA